MSYKNNEQYVFTKDGENWLSCEVLGSVSNGNEKMCLIVTKDDVIKVPSGNVKKIA